MKQIQSYLWLLELTATYIKAQKKSYPMILNSLGIEFLQRRLNLKAVNCGMIEFDSYEVLLNPVWSRRITFQNCRHSEAVAPSAPESETSLAATADE